MTDQITVSRSPLPELLWTLARQIAPPVMAFALAKGWIDNDTMALLAALAGIAAPIIYGQLRTYSRSQALVTLADAVPDELGKVT